MYILVAALEGAESNETISLLINIGGKPAVALVDSGSSNTFIDYDFAVRMNMPMRETAARTVTVAGGGTLTTTSFIPSCPFTIQKIKVQSDFNVLPLKGYDIVLGVSWLKQYNPTTFDWVARTLALTKDKVEHIFYDHLLPAKRPNVTAKKCSQILRKGASGYILQFIYVQDQEVIKQAEPPKWPATTAKILAEHSDVFEAPKRLPPKRSCDHKIILKEGATCNTPATPWPGMSPLAAL